MALAPITSFAADARKDFLQLLDRPRVPLAPQTKSAKTHDGVVEIPFSFAVEAGQRVPGILVKTETSTGHRPAVIVLHGTGGKKEDELPYAIELARAGFVSITIDGRYHGARTKAGKGSDEYVASILQAFRTGKEHPFFFDSAWDIMRLVDYLETRDDIDSRRLGIFGVSKGGIEAYLAAAVDPRLAAVVPCIAVESFRWAAENNSWQSRIGTVQAAFDTAAKESNVTNPNGDFVHAFYNRVSPGIDREFDGPSMVPLIAPRPLLAINGEIDPRTPRPGLDLCDVAIRAAYHEAKADDHYVLHIQPKTAHRVLPESRVLARDWFVRWLKP